MKYHYQTHKIAFQKVFTRKRLCFCKQDFLTFIPKKTDIFILLNGFMQNA